MSEEMRIDVALANLQAGKFSFRTADAIKTHIATLESEHASARDLHDSAIRELRLQEYANLRLESELRKLNAKIQALLRVNMLVEAGDRHMRTLASELRGLLDAATVRLGACPTETTARLRNKEFWVALRNHLAQGLKQSLERARDLGAFTSMRLQAANDSKFAREVREKVARVLAQLFTQLRIEKSDWLKRQISSLDAYRQVFKKQASTSLQKATAYLSSVRSQA